MHPLFLLQVYDVGFEHGGIDVSVWECLVERMLLRLFQLLLLLWTLLLRCCCSGGCYHFHHPDVVVVAGIAVVVVAKGTAEINSAVDDVLDAAS